LFVCFNYRQPSAQIEPFLNKKESKNENKVIRKRASKLARPCFSLLIRLTRGAPCMLVIACWPSHFTHSARVTKPGGNLAGLVSGHVCAHAPRRPLMLGHAILNLIFEFEIQKQKSRPHF
jgi:hypothetical protein